MILHHSKLRCTVYVVIMAVTAACVPTQRTVVRKEYATETVVHGDYSVGGLRNGTYMLVKVGLVASASATPDSPDGKRLGQIAMNQLVRNSELRRNQALVNVTVERARAYEGEGSERNEIEIVTIRADVIEFFSKDTPPGSGKPAPFEGAGEPAKTEPPPSRAPQPEPTVVVKIGITLGEGNAIDIRMAGVRGGMVAQKVTPGGPGASAGIRPGDIIVQIGAQPVTDRASAMAALAALQPGRPVTIKFVREGKPQSAELVPEAK